MTHSRKPAASPYSLSTAGGNDRDASGAPDRDPDARRQSGDRDPSGAPDGLDDRSRRARTESMTVAAFGTNTYEVRTDGSSYLVDVGTGRCDCPDHRLRGARCKHLRRVALEITAGLVPPPGQVAVDCRDCDRTAFVDADAPAAGDRPYYCRRHRITPGDAVRDRETGQRLVAVSAPGGRAADVPAGDCSVADHPSNEGYDPDGPVVGAVYPSARVTDDGVAPDGLQVYAFPRDRLRRIDPPEPVAAGRDAGGDGRTRNAHRSSDAHGARRSAASDVDPSADDARS